VRIARTANSDRVLTREALAFVVRLHREFEGRRRQLLAQRGQRQVALDSGARPRPLLETSVVRETEWKIAPPPADLERRWVEITGPVERKMMINALNSGADVFMADFEDSLSPTWQNVIDGHVNLQDAVRRTIDFHAPNGKECRLNDKVATLVVRPRGWHMSEKHVEIDGQRVSASLLDFGLYMYHNAWELRARGTGPYFYLPKMENHREARLWNDVFVYAQDALGMPQGTIRATVLIESVLAAFEMEEILYELREHSVGLNAGRWDYIFSMIKKFRRAQGQVLPDRSQVTMTVPFMRAYTELLVHTCHKRGAHAIGGMAAFIPSRRDPEVNERALAAVRADKARESRDGFDGTWVAHPDLVPIAREAFHEVLGQRPHQKDRLREDVEPAPDALIDLGIPAGCVTLDGVRQNISVALQYLAAWLAGSGAVAIYNLMENTATAEVSRAQLWQWREHGVVLDDGRTMSDDLYEEIRGAELERLRGDGIEDVQLDRAAGLLDSLVLASEFTPFLTLPGYRYLT
jgi:malate synthase